MSVERVVTSDRGFRAYGADPIECSYGGRLTVAESSAASGDYMWLTSLGFDAPKNGPSAPIGYDRDAPYRAALHLDRAAVVELRARLGAWLDDHPT